MQKDFNYKSEDGVNWSLSISHKTATVKCLGQEKKYKLDGSFTDTQQFDNEYVYIFMERDNEQVYYKFTFDYDCYLIIDIYDSDGTFKSQLDSYQF